VAQLTTRLCDSGVLAECATGMRFTIAHIGEAAPAFAIRYHGNVYAYLNRCAHKLVELDWEPGRFFDNEGCHLICATHGALYDPASGECVAGPCRGARLVAVAIEEKDGAVWLAQPGYAGDRTPNPYQDMHKDGN
jgi:nitrite reductase/ring-hydroxylating ferredoxin subunit